MNPTTVVVRWATVDAVDADSPPRWLSDGELTRLGSMRQVLDQQRFIGARIILRTAVSEAVGCAESRVELRQHCDRCGGPHGRPRVTIAGAPGPHVSMAHAGNLAVVALAGQPVGIDLEPLGADPDALRTWVRTEAVLKATGHGLDVDPSFIEVSDPLDTPRLLSWKGPGRRPALRMADLAICDGYATSIARLGRRRMDIEASPVELMSTAPTAPTASTSVLPRQSSG